MRSPSPTRSFRDTDKILINRSDGDLFVVPPEQPDHVRLRTRYEVSPELPKAGSIETSIAELDGTEKDTSYTCGWPAIIVVSFAIFAMAMAVLLLPGPTLPTTSSPTDPIIAVVGATGAGKSSFIEMLGGRDASGNKPGVGHNLESCTRNVTWYHASVDAQSVQLLDTPGFDDTTLSDSEVLEAISLELARIYKGSRSLNGLIYLYDVSRPRFGGQSSKNLMLFQQLVGDESLKNVVLVTTHWKQSDAQQLERQDELKTKYWKRMTLYGARIEKHDGSKKSAVRIIQPLISMSPTVVKIVDELVDQGLQWEDTAVGRSMSEAIAQLQKKMKEELAAVTSYLQEIEEKRATEAHQEQKDRASLQDQHRRAAEESDRKAMDIIAELTAQMKTQQEAQHALLQEQWREAAREKEEYLRALKEGIRVQQRPKRKFNGDAFENVPNTPSWVPAPHSAHLYFSYPRYHIFDIPAWISWVLLELFTFLMWLGITCTGAFELRNAPFSWEIFLIWVVVTVLQIWRAMSFGTTFLHSCGADSQGLIWLVWEIAQIPVYFTWIYKGSGPTDKDWKIFIAAASCVTLRYLLTPCPLDF